MVTNPLIVVATLADTFDQLGIPYLVDGSLASSLHGVPRATQDADIVADVRVRHVEPLTRLLEEDFYVARELISDAIRDRGSFNVIHLATMFKADIFVPAGMHGLVKKWRAHEQRAFSWPNTRVLSGSRVPKIRSCTSYSGIVSAAKHRTNSGATWSASLKSKGSQLISPT